MVFSRQHSRYKNKFNCSFCTGWVVHLKNTLKKGKASETCKSIFVFLPREVESELEIIWESTTKENRRMKELLHKSLEKRNTQSPVRAYESDLADISQKDLLAGYGFSYCDVELLLPAKTQSQLEPAC